MKLPDSFRTRIEKDFPEHCQQLLESYRQPASTSLRLHPKKGVGLFENNEVVPWHSNGRQLSSRPAFSKDPMMHAGGYYVQESSSMFLDYVLKTIDLKPDTLALDLCAAPGGKSTILLENLGSEGHLIANEVSPKRNPILQEFCTKWGYPNFCVTQLTAEKIAGSSLGFDLVLIDAPCSGEGMFRKDEFALTQWSNALVHQCAITQRELIDTIAPSVKSGGYIIYSTCTLNKSENEAQISHLIEQHGFEVVALDPLPFKSIVNTERNGATLGYYFLPGLVKGEGLFMSVLQKSGAQQKTEQRKFHGVAEARAFDFQLPIHPDHSVFEWAGNVFLQAQNHHHLSVVKALPMKLPGLEVGHVKGNKTIPAQGLANWIETPTGVNLSTELAREYLKRSTLPRDLFSTRGWQLVAHDHLNLGWVNVLESRVNNAYPKHWRIRH